MGSFSKVILRIGLIISIFTIFANADIAPNPDEIQVSHPLIIETSNDVSDYRFFLHFAGDFREIEVKSNGKTEIPSMGGGVRYSSGMIIAIPKKFLNDFPNKIGSSFDDIGKRFSDLISQKKIGVIELGTHNFSRVVKKSESAKYVSSPYLLVKDSENGLKLTRLEVPKGKGGGVDFTVYGRTKSLTTFGYIVLVSFPTAAIFIFGIWLFRKKGRKLN